MSNRATREMASPGAAASIREYRMLRRFDKYVKDGLSLQTLLFVHN
jgi:hypothetical protein